MPPEPLAAPKCFATMILRVGKLRCGDDGSFEEPGHASQPADFQRDSVPISGCKASQLNRSSAPLLLFYLKAAVMLLDTVSVTVQVSVVDGHAVDVTSPPQPVNV